MTKFSSLSEWSQWSRLLFLYCLRTAIRVIGPTAIGLMATPLAVLADNSVIAQNTPINPPISGELPQSPDRPTPKPLKPELPKLDLRVEPKVDFKLEPKVNPTINLIKPNVPIVSDPELGILRSQPLVPKPITPTPTTTPVPTSVPTALPETSSETVEPLEPGSDPELGTIKIRETPPSSPPPKPRRATSLYLLGHFDYFQTNNVFSSIPLRADGAVRTGLSLYYLPPLGPQTYLLVLAESNILRYGTFSRLNYDELRLKVGLYQQLTPRVSGEIGWSYQQLTAAKEELKNLFQGVRFFNEHALRFDLTRQDSLSPALKLTTGYQFRWNLTGDIEKYDRLVNSGNISLSYKLSPRMNAGLDYQASWTHFTQQSRDDVSHYLGANLSYSFNDRVSFNAFGGRVMAVSSEQRIEPSSWIFGLGFNFNVGLF